MNSWLNYELLDTSISAAELLLALLSAGAGGLVVGKSSALVRLRVEKRAELLALFESRSLGPDFANGTGLAELLPESPQKWVEDPQRLQDHVQDSFEAFAGHIRSLGKADELVELLPFFDRLCWRRYRCSLEPFETDVGAYMIKARRVRVSIDGGDEEGLAAFIQTHDRLRMKVLGFNAVLSEPFGRGLGLDDHRNRDDPLYQALFEGRDAMAAAANAAVALRSFLRRRLRPSVANTLRGRREQVVLLRWWVSRRWADRKGQA